MESDMCKVISLYSESQTMNFKLQAFFCEFRKYRHLFKNGKPPSDIVLHEYLSFLEEYRCFLKEYNNHLEGKTP